MSHRESFSPMPPDASDKILLHACCAPCSGAIIEYLLGAGVMPVLFYSNSNIFPVQEYEKRRDECVRYCRTMGIEFVEDAYDHGIWRSCAAEGLENEPERGRRCLSCFKFRLRRAAEYACANGFTVLTTTLASSRWKDLNQVDEAGRWACAAANGSSKGTQVIWWGQNWRRGGLQPRRNEIIREQRFYNQLWCGCEYSLRSAQISPEIISSETKK